MARGTNTSTKHKGMSYTKFGYLFIAPFVVVYCLFSLYPLLTTFWYSGTFMQNTNAGFWGFSNREVYYDRYLDLTKVYASFDGGLEGQTGINTTDYKNMQAFFQTQNAADQYDPIDPEALQNIVENPDISQATRDKVQQVINTGDISYIASDSSVIDELVSWSANYVDLGIIVLDSLKGVNNAAIAAATVEESESDTEVTITAEDILGSDDYAAFLDTLQAGDFDEGQTLLVNYLAEYAGVDSLYDFFAAEDVSVESDVFYYICANLNSPNAVYTSADGETSIASISVPFMNDLTTYLNSNVWSTTVPAINSYSSFQGYIDGDIDLHSNQEQLYSDLAALDAMGLIVNKVKLVQSGDTLVQSSEVSQNVLAAMRQYIDSNYQSDPIKSRSSLAISSLRNYLDNGGRTRLTGYNIDVDSYITFNDDFDVSKYLAFKSLIGLGDVLTMDKYNELDAAMRQLYVDQARVDLETAQGKLPAAQQAYDAAVASGDADQIDSANNALARVVSDINKAEQTIKRPTGLLSKADATEEYLFVGLDNFEDIFQNKNRFNVVVGAFYTTAVMWVIGFIPQILLALLLSAWFTDTKLKLKGLNLMKALMYLPNVITAATIAIFFRRLFSFSTGQAASPVQLFLDAIGHERINFFINPWATRLIVCFINFWMWYGNTMIVLIAGITSISESLYESAQLDGANSFQTYTKITMPLLRPILLYTLVTSMIGGLQMYDIPYNLNQYPSLVAFNGTYIKSTQTVLMYVNQLAFGKSSIKQVGIASAVSVILFIVTTILSILIFFLMRDKDAAAAAKAKKLARKAGR
ncbi:MAG: ABC transporter permease subunit [Clostridiales bacterium]|nr:ABC transporter permease subunit [Clostridiales bacterium]